MTPSSRGGTGANTVEAAKVATASPAGTGADLGNEGNDDADVAGAPTPCSAARATTTISCGIGRETIQGNEETTPSTVMCSAGQHRHHLGGSGNDVFVYFDVSADGDNAAGGGRSSGSPTSTGRWVRYSFSGDLRHQFFGARGRSHALTSASSAGGGAHVAAQFTFGGRTYLAIDQNNLGTFADTDDWLIDTTGVTGTIATSNFI